MLELASSNTRILCDIGAAVRLVLLGDYGGILSMRIAKVWVGSSLVTRLIGHGCATET